MLKMRLKIMIKNLSAIIIFKILSSLPYYIYAIIS